MRRPPSPQPDFLRPARRSGPLAWAWCATGLLVLAAAGLEAAEVWQQRQQAVDRLARVEAAAPDATRPTLRAAEPAQAPAAVAFAAGSAATGALAPDAATRALDAQATRWLQRLALPWPAVFAAAETAAVDGTQFTGLGFDAQGQLRLEGLAAQPGPALAAAEALRAAGPGDGGSAAAAWQGVTLARLDSTADGRRFEIVARLAAPAAR